MQIGTAWEKKNPLDKPITDLKYFFFTLHFYVFCPKLQVITLTLKIFEKSLEMIHTEMINSQKDQIKLNNKKNK